MIEWLNDGDDNDDDGDDGDDGDGNDGDGDDHGDGGGDDHGDGGGGGDDDGDEVKKNNKPWQFVPTWEISDHGWDAYPKKKNCGIPDHERIAPQIV